MITKLFPYLLFIHLWQKPPISILRFDSNQFIHLDIVNCGSGSRSPELSLCCSMLEWKIERLGGKCDFQRGCAVIATLSCNNFFSPNRSAFQTNPCWTRWSHWCRLVYLIGFNWSDSETIKCAKNATGAFDCIPPW